MNQDQFVRVAKAMCQADGHDPDGTYLVGGLETVKHGTAAALQSKKAPLWTKYEADARRFIAAANALSTT